MPKTKITDWSTTRASNSDADGINIAEGCPAGNLNDGLREIMVQVAETNAGTYPVADTWSFADPADLTKIVRLDAGGITTGQTRVLSVPDYSGTIATLAGTETLTNKTLTSPAVNTPQGEFLRSHIYDLTLSNNATDATNDIDISTGSAASDGTTPALMTLSSAITKQLDATWAVGTNAGGLDTGAAANTSYQVWLIQRSDTGVVDVLFSTSATSPTMPTNYDRKRRIGSFYRTSGAIVGFQHVMGDMFLYNSPILDVAAVNPGTSAVLRTLSVPIGISVEALLNVGIVNDGVLDYSAAYLSYPGTTDIAATRASYTTAGAVANVSGGTKYAAAQARVVTNTSRQIRSRLVYSDANVQLNIVTLGWIDRRGKL